ncbi:MAG: hypothetical protein DRP74_06220 [Candidatus Omnitrophota bacterium]|nr:MAG: hypothetical protein DRP74_06220 [Candidatus Omnitrophota bacterium]
MGYKILFVDDDKEIAESIKDKLTKEGYDVILAYDGQEALSKVKEADPDIILLDLMLPNLNGFEVLKEIREKHNDRWRPVIIISAKNEFDSVKQCYNLQADHYLVKPCKMEDILQGIKIMISLMPVRKQ